LDRDANSHRTINAQDHLPVLIARADADAELDFKALLASELDRSVDEIAAFELCFYPTDFGQIIGLHEEFIASARLDNLLSCWVTTEALVRTAPTPDGTMLVLNDHEEVGSQSAIGADSPFLESVLRRVTPADAFERVRASSLLVSVDNGHAVHPNFAARHDEGHRPLLNEGPVVKINANHRYATTALSQGIVEQAAQRADVPLQYFSSRADVGCGSTLGPITASRLGIETVDLGMATLAMHSARELCGVKDPELMLRLLHALATREMYS
jgi:aspartyl aminopeptidase